MNTKYISQETTDCSLEVHRELRKLYPYELDFKWEKVYGKIYARMKESIRKAYIQGYIQSGRDNKVDTKLNPRTKTAKS